MLGFVAAKFTRGWHHPELSHEGGTDDEPDPRSTCTQGTRPVVREWFCGQHHSVAGGAYSGGGSANAGLQKGRP